MPVFSTLLLLYGIIKLVGFSREFTRDISEYREYIKRKKRLKSVLQTDKFMRDTANDDTVRDYYAQRCREVTVELRQLLREESI